MTRYMIGDPLADALLICKTSLYYRFLLNVVIIFVLINVWIKKILGDAYLSSYRVSMVMSSHIFKPPDLTS